MPKKITITFYEKEAKIVRALKKYGVLALIKKFIPPGSIVIHYNRKKQIRHKEIHEYPKDSG